MHLIKSVIKKTKKIFEYLEMINIFNQRYRICDITEISERSKNGEDHLNQHSPRGEVILDHFPIS